MTTQKERRMEKIEELMAPKEWAIRYANELRKTANLAEFLRCKRDKSWPFKGWMLSNKFKALAKAKHPGGRPEDRQVQEKLYRDFWIDFKTRQNLILNTVGETEKHAEFTGLKATVKLQSLITFILMDSFSRTADKASTWIQEYKAHDENEEKNRQGMLDELDAYIVNVKGLHSAESQSMDLGFGKLYFPSTIEDWIDSVKALVFDVFCHQAAVKVIQDQYFDGHTFLARNVEAKLDHVIQTIRDTIEQHNEYLDVRENLFGEEWEEDEAEELDTALAGERSGRLKINLNNLQPPKKTVEKMAREWAKAAKLEATGDVKRNPEELERMIQGDPDLERFIFGFSERDKG